MGAGTHDGEVEGQAAVVEVVVGVVGVHAGQSAPLGRELVRRAGRLLESGPVRLEPVAHPRLGDEVARPARLGLELAAHRGMNTRR